MAVGLTPSTPWTPRSACGVQWSYTFYTLATLRLAWRRSALRLQHFGHLRGTLWRWLALHLLRPGHHGACVAPVGMTPSTPWTPRCGDLGRGEVRAKSMRGHIPSVAQMRVRMWPLRCRCLETPVGRARACQILATGLVARDAASATPQKGLGAPHTWENQPNASRTPTERQPSANRAPQDSPSLPELTFCGSWGAPGLLKLMRCTVWGPHHQTSTNRASQASLNF